MAAYLRYTHVERLTSEEAAGLLDNPSVYVTAKVDGTNGCVWWDDETDSMGVGSRNRVLTADDDNGDFLRWSRSDAEEVQLLEKWCQTHPRTVVYGEWMGLHTFMGAFKAYDRRALGTFIIFDVWDEDAQAYLPEERWREELAAFGLEPYFVKLFGVLDHPSMDEVAKMAQANDFLLEGTGLVGEGVVCKVPGWTNQWGRPVYGKLVLDEFKKQAKPRVENAPVEPQIVDAYVTDSEIEKTMAKVCARFKVETFDGSDRRMMGMLDSLCWRDLLDECPNWVKRFKKPTVNFGQLSGLMSKRLKAYVDKQAS